MTQSPAAATPTPPVPRPSAYIDVHCHIFNARDVPTYSFVEDVFLENEVLRVVGAPFVLLLTQIAARSAPTYQQEKEILAPSTSGPDVAEAKFEQRSDEEIFTQGFKHFLDEDRPFTDSEGITDTLPRDRFVRQLYEIFLPGRVPRDLIPQDFGATTAEPANIRALFNEMQASRKQKGDGLRQYIAQFLTYWAVRLAYPRFRLAQELGTLGPDPGIPRLLTPAMLDIGNWLAINRAGAEPTPPTSLSDQADLMRLICLQPRPSAVHGFIPFDPWRYADDCVLKRSPNALDLVDKALTCDGFIGVKLYPPMGFQASGNAARPPEEFPEAFRANHHSSPGKALDDALGDLYRYCIKHDVPIMAHCAATNGTSLRNSLCADPVFWHEVLKQDGFRTLRLNLSHFGAVWNLARTTERASDTTASDRTLLASDTVAWTGYIVRMIEENDFPNVYTDFGDFSVVLGRSDTELAKRTAIFERLGELVLNPANRKIRSRLMYGSDWLLLGREPGVENYYAQMRDQLLQQIKVSPDDFFWKNAARFLGLGASDRTRDRLRKFYLDNQGDPAVLDPFQA